MAKTRVVFGKPLKGRKAIYRRSVRQQMPKSCFLQPGKRAYPICPANSAKSGKRVVDCRLVSAAKKRAAQQHQRAVASKAARLEARYCKRK